MNSWMLMACLLQGMNRHFSMSVQIVMFIWVKIKFKLSNFEVGFVKFREYLPMGGSNKMIEESLKLAYGDDSEFINDKRIAAVQSLSGTGACRLFADFQKRFLPDSQIYIPVPTWAKWVNLRLSYYILFFFCIYSYDYLSCVELQIISILLWPCILTYLIEITWYSGSDVELNGVSVLSWQSFSWFRFWCLVLQPS